MILLRSYATMFSKFLALLTLVGGAAAFSPRFLPATHAQAGEFDFHEKRVAF